MTSSAIVCRGPGVRQPVHSLACWLQALPARPFRFEHAPIKSALAPVTHSVAAASYASMHSTAAEPGQAIEYRKAPFLI
jgi:hypothetical protein